MAGIKKVMLIPVIDIFAGPGGLGEGFSTYFAGENRAFKIRLSIEKDAVAHQTLELRAFYRQFSTGAVPIEYYEYLRRENSIDKSSLFAKYPKEAEAAKREAWMATLGEEDRDAVKTRINEALSGSANWVLIGGPPCQAYSLVGRSRMRGKNPWKYAKDHRHYLYKEYLQILADHQPPVFVMENVKGLLSSSRTKTKKQNTFELIRTDLKNPIKAIYGNDSSLSYRLFSISSGSPANPDDIKPEDFVIRSEEYGIPQARHRIIIIGIRSDIYDSSPMLLRKVEKQVPIEAVISDLPKLRSGLSKERDTPDEWRKAIKEIETAKWMKSVSSELKNSILGSLKRVGASLDRGNSFTPFIVGSTKYDDWYIDGNLAGVCNHESRSHIREDLHRYFFSAVFAQKYKRPPKLSDFPSELLPKHKNAKNISSETIFNDRFRVQVKGRPSTTVVSHISKDGHYYIHYDPAQCRSLTVREAARLQTFPDNYFFEGNRTQQYHQVGNAVPPLLANKIAEIVYKILQGI
jgi:DNA (cytosine-5)-methyltransferase 1